MANCGLLLNDGTSFLLLNSGTDFLLLNDNSCTTEPGAGTTPVVTPTIPPGLWYDHSHRGSLYWKRYKQWLKKCRKKAEPEKCELLDELGEVLVELQERVEEAEPTYYAPPPDFGLLTQPIADVTMNDIQRQIAAIKDAIEEMDDEETLLLSIH